MNELKPENVMRALECCEENKKDCAKCPQREKCVTSSDFPFFFPHLLPLLREKDAEIERLTSNMNGYAFTAQTLSKEFEDYRADVQMEIADARAEAIAEFVAELETHYPHSPNVMNTVRRVAEKMKGI